MKKNIAAFFDIDGTLYREGLITEVFKKMIKYEIIEPEKWYNDVRQDFEKWDRRQGDYDTYLLKMIDIYMEAIKGLNKYQIEFIAKRVIEQKGDRVYTFTRDRIKWHKEQGHILITVSGSPIELVKEMSLKGGNPYAMNPTNELLRKILSDKELSERINIIVERKDVTYNLNVENIQFE